MFSLRMADVVAMATVVSAVPQRNVQGGSLDPCSFDPLTGWYRDGYCKFDAHDPGSHTVCANITQAFLDYSASVGNDLATPHPPGFPGLNSGDLWCLCAARWRQALGAGVAPGVVLGATHEAALQVATLAQLSGGGGGAGGGQGEQCPAAS